MSEPWEPPADRVSPTLEIEAAIRDGAYLYCELVMPLFGHPLQQVVDETGVDARMPSDACLRRLTIKQFNKLVKLGYWTPDEANEVRRRRRRLKNQVYARNARERARCSKCNDHDDDDDDFLLLSPQ